MILMTPADLVELVAEIAAFDTECECDEHETMHFIDEYDDDKTPDMNFADALSLLQTGWTVARRAWHAERSISFTGLSNPIYISDLKASDWYVL